MEPYRLHLHFFADAILPGACVYLYRTALEFSPDVS